MNLKSERGYTGIDIAIGIVVLFIFVSLIASLSYTFNSSARDMELRAEATSIAVEEMENLKNSLNFEAIANRSIANGNSEYGITEEEIKTGFFRTIIIEDYADISANKRAGLVKKVTVSIQYKFKGKQEVIKLSTIFSKEN